MEIQAQLNKTRTAKTQSIEMNISQSMLRPNSNSLSNGMLMAILINRRDEVAYKICSNCPIVVCKHHHLTEIWYKLKLVTAEPEKK